MKKLSLVISLLIITVVLGDFNLSYAWDTTAAKYYPLAVGNQWSYHRINRTGPSCIMFTNSYDYIVRVVSDTMMPNGKKYYKIQGPAVTFERVDSLTMNVYKYSSGSECMTDSLMTRINNNFNSCRQLNSTGQFNVEDTIPISFASQMRSVKNIRGNQLIGHQYVLMYGMGIYRESACENGGAIITLNGCIINGIQYGDMISGLTTINSEIPIEFSLSQNYPNPFNPTTKLKLEIPKSGFAKLTVYDLLGREVQTLVNQHLSPGTYEVDFDGSNQPSGVYYYKLESSAFTETKKMVLIK